jgi:hypothetical protein
LNPGRRGGKPATNRFSYGAAFLRILININHFKDFVHNYSEQLEKVTSPVTNAYKIFLHDVFPQATSAMCSMNVAILFHRAVFPGKRNQL